MSNFALLLVCFALGIVLRRTQRVPEATPAAREPLVVVRTLQNELKAYFNVCPHRAAVVAHGKGNRKSLQCKYHGWTYDLEGKLMRAPEFEGVQNWQANNVCLQGIKCEAWGPWVFVNLDPNAAPMAEIYDPIHKEIVGAGSNIDQMKLVERRDYIINCNWKVYVDNYLEGYHLPIAHPGLFREPDYDQYRVDTFEDYSSQYAPIRPAKPDDPRTRHRRYVRSEGGCESGFEICKRSKFKSPRATRIKVGCSSAVISRAAANNAASCLDGRRSPDSSFRKAKMEQPARAASSSWVRSSALRRCLSHSPNKTGVSKFSNLCCRYPNSEKILTFAQFTNKRFMPILGKIVAHFWGEFRGLLTVGWGFTSFTSLLMIWLLSPLFCFARPDGTGQNM